MNKTMSQNELTLMARSSKTNEELSAACLQLNIADEIFLGKVDLWLAKHALSAVYRTQRKYPRLRERFNYFGTLNGFISLKEKLIRELYSTYGDAFRTAILKATDDIAVSTLHMFRQTGLASAFFTGAGDVFFSGIIINGKSLNKQTILKNLEYGEKMGHAPVGCKTVKSVIEHEIGHLLDYALSISTCKEYQAFIQNFTAEAIYNGLSHYCIVNNSVSDREVVAEGYSEYCNNPFPREIATAIGEIIHKKYEGKYGF